MKAELKNYAVEYWTCYDKDHHHRTKTIAENCIARQDRIKAIVKNDWSIDRLKELLVLRDTGITFKEMGKKYNISPARMRQVYYRAYRKQKNGRI